MPMSNEARGAARASILCQTQGTGRNSLERAMECILMGVTTLYLSPGSRMLVTYRPCRDAERVDIHEVLAVMQEAYEEKYGEHKDL